MEKIIEKINSLNKKQKIIFGIIVLVVLSSFVSKLTGSGEKYKDKPVNVTTTTEQATTQITKSNDPIPVIKGTNAKILAAYYDEKYPENFSKTKHFDYGTKFVVDISENGLILLECSEKENEILAIMFYGQDTKSFMEDIEVLLTKMLEGSEFGNGTIQGLVNWCKDNSGTNKKTNYNGLYVETEINDNDYIVVIGCEKYDEWINEKHPNFDEELEDMLADFKAAASLEETTEEPTTEELTTEEPTTEEPTTEEPTTEKSSGVTPSFKEQMDAYEAFFDEYVSFMNKYMANPTDMSLMMDYLSFMTKYTDYMDAIDSMDEDEMSDADLAYYLEVTARIESKLIGVIF